MSIDIRKELAKRLAPHFETQEDRIYSLLEVPPRPDFGDFAIPCFYFASILKKDPSNIASSIQDRVNQDLSEGAGIIKKVVSRGPYLNIFIDRSFFIRNVVGELTRNDFEELRSIGNGKTVVIDFSSPNIAKPFGIGHLRSTVIGNSLKKIFSFLGYRVVGINHLGDWGTQFGKLITAIKRWGSEKELESAENPVEYLYRIYVKFHSEAEKNPSLDDEARLWFKKLESGDEEARRLWERFRNLSIDEFKRIYKRIGVEFEYYTGESFYSSMLDETIDLIKSKGITKVSDGALIVPFDDPGIPPALLRKRDGTTLYITRDIAAALYRFKTFHFDLALYVVGSPQTLHFKQLFKVLELMGLKWHACCHHIPFGQIRFADGAMSTRKGNIVFLEDVLDRAVELALHIIEEKNPSLEEKRSVAESVGIGSIIFNDLKNYRIKDINFDWDEMINFDGETGPYLQYTHTRSSSLLKKYADQYGNLEFDPSINFGEEGYQLCLLLNEFEPTVLKSTEEFEPSIISRYLLDLASQFNSFYNAYRVISDDRELSRARALLVACVKKVLKTGLELLGIEALKEM
jgi:arginyl-tRNA synthetase